MSTDDLVFMKQLLDNAEYANKTGVRNVINLLRSGEPSVIDGTSFAGGALETLRGLIEKRPELFDAEIVAELESVAREHGDARVQTLAERAAGSSAT